MKTIRKLIACLWIPIPPIMLSALFHLADGDIDGWAALATYSVLWSVLLFGTLTAGYFYFCLVSLVDSGWFRFVVNAGAFAVFFGFLLAAFASGATTALGRLWSFVGVSGLLFFTVSLAVVPAATLGWPQLVCRQVEKSPA